MNTYVTNPVLWDSFYKNMSQESFEPYKIQKRKKVQKGRGLYRRFKASYLIPVNRNATEADQKAIQTKQVLLQKIADFGQ